MLGNVKRYAMETEDWLRYHPALRSALSRYKLWSDRVSPPRDDQGLARSIVKLCAAARLASLKLASELDVPRTTKALAELLPKLEPRLQSARPTRQASKYTSP